MQQNLEITKACKSTVVHQKLLLETDMLPFFTDP